MHVSFIGIGNVGFALADNLVELGHHVTIAEHDPDSDSIREALEKNSSLTALPMKESIGSADVVFLTPPFNTVESILKEHASVLKGKVLVDATNPVGEGLTHSLDNKQSGGEFIQSLVPDTRVVKAFNVYGYENFENNDFSDYENLKPAMFTAGNDPDARATVRDLCNQLGWEVVECGDISTSLQLEHMALLWIKLVRNQGMWTRTVWGKMSR